MRGPPGDRERRRAPAPAATARKVLRRRGRREAQRVDSQARQGGERERRRRQRLGGVADAVQGRQAPNERAGRARAREEDARHRDRGEEEREAPALSLEERRGRGERQRAEREGGEIDGSAVPAGAPRARQRPRAIGSLRRPAPPRAARAAVATIGRAPRMGRGPTRRAPVRGRRGPAEARRTAGRPPATAGSPYPPSSARRARPPDEEVADGQRRGGDLGAAGHGLEAEHGGQAEAVASPVEPGAGERRRGQAARRTRRSGSSRPTARRQSRTRRRARRRRPRPLRKRPPRAGTGAFPR